METPGGRRTIFTRRVVIAGCAGLVALCVAMPAHASSAAQIDGTPASHIVVGAWHVPPFMMKTASGRWEGLSVELWHEVTQTMGVEFEWREYGSLAEIRGALVRGEIDAVPGMAITEQHEVLFDFSHPYYTSGSGIAVSTTGMGHSWLNVARSLFSWGTLRLIGFLVLLWVIAGVAMWLCERRQNEDMIADGPRKALEHGIWWAAVTMTTVGYGDIAPKTLVGRVVAAGWMLISIVLIAGFTASITTALTVGAFGGKIRDLQDLYGVRVGSVADSESAMFLSERDIDAVSFPNERDGLLAIVNDELDAVVYDKAVLAYLENTEFPNRVRTIHGVFNPYYLGIALQPGSALREPIDRALLGIMEREGWGRLIARYLGSETLD